MKVVNKLLIILIGLIIITFLVFKLFEKDKNIEGMGIPTLFGLPKFMLQTAEVSVDAAATGAEVGRDVAKAASDTAADIAAATQRQALDTKKTIEMVADSAAEEGTDNIRFGISTALSTAIGIAGRITTTMGQLFQNVKAAIEAAWKYSTLVMVVGVCLLLGGYVWKVGVWSINMLSCLFTMFGNFSSCFFYYFLDIVGYVLYLPFAIMFWLFRMSIETYYSDCSKDEYPPIYNIEKEIWDLIYWVDCQVYDATGFHIFHYSEDIMKRCYSCSPGPFPPFPNLFSPAGWRKAIKEYNAFSMLGKLPPFS